MSRIYAVLVAMSDAQRLNAMKIDQSHPLYNDVKLIEDCAGAIVDGTFAVVNQTKMIELWSFSGMTESSDETIYYAVKTSTLTEGFDGIYNPSYTKEQGAPLSDIYADDQITTYFDDQLEAHEFFCQFIMNNQLEGM